MQDAVVEENRTERKRKGERKRKEEREACTQELTGIGRAALRAAKVSACGLRSDEAILERTMRSLWDPAGLRHRGISSGQGWGSNTLTGGVWRRVYKPPKSRPNSASKYGAATVPLHAHPRILLSLRLCSFNESCFHFAYALSSVTARTLLPGTCFFLDVIPVHRCFIPAQILYHLLLSVVPPPPTRLLRSSQLSVPHSWLGGWEDGLACAMSDLLND
eukprot:764010-Hanusia_phi.AAC.2